MSRKQTVIIIVSVPLATLISLVISDHFNLDITKHLILSGTLGGLFSLIFTLLIED